MKKSSLPLLMGAVIGAQALLNGASIEEALNLVRRKLHEGDINDIELF